MVLVTPTKPKPAGREILVNPLPASMPGSVILPVRVKPPALQVMHVKLEENIKLVVILVAEPKTEIVLAGNLQAPVPRAQHLLFAVFQAAQEFLPPVPLRPVEALPVRLCFHRLIREVLVVREVLHQVSLQTGAEIATKAVAIFISKQEQILIS